MILLATRYQQNPQGGFPTFQIDVQMQKSIISNVVKGSSCFVIYAFICWGKALIFDIYKIFYIICVYCTQQRFADCHHSFTAAMTVYVLKKAFIFWRRAFIFGDYHMWVYVIGF